MQWEYCVIPFVRSGYGEFLCNPELWCLRTDGTQVTRIPLPPRFTSKGIKRKANAVMQAIARLGEEGWELVGCGNDDPAGHMLYFKRPKQET